MTLYVPGLRYEHRDTRRVSSVTDGLRDLRLDVDDLDRRAGNGGAGRVDDGSDDGAAEVLGQHADSPPPRARTTSRRADES